MLDGTTLGLTRGFGLIVHHADGEREYAYERYPNYGAELDVALDEAKGWNWVIVDMAEDWKAVFTNSKDKDARMFDAIVGPTWTLMSIDGLSVVDQSNANMIFGVGGKVAGNTGSIALVEPLRSAVTELHWVLWRRLAGRDLQP